MSKNKKTGFRSRNIYNPGQNETFRISRSKFEAFLKCKRCFYLDRVKGVKFPDSPPFTLNNLVDELCKREFNDYRKKKKPHPLFKKINFNGIPYDHENIEDWQNAMHKGIQHKDSNTNLLLTGGIDDVWLNLDTNKLVIADYKATAKRNGVPDNILETEFYTGYKIQLDFYAWLFKKNDFDISADSYFLFFNGSYDKKDFKNVMDFDPKFIYYKNDTSWIDKEVSNMKSLLDSKNIPDYTAGCKFCDYSFAIKVTF